MHDIEMIVPAELNSTVIAQRLKDFKKWGLVNTENVDIKIYFMASCDNNQTDLDALCKGWPSNFTVEGIITPYKHVAQRIMYYYDKIMKEDTARWYMRLDEDSITDVRNLLARMDDWFDYKRDYHVVGEISREPQDIEYKILTNLGYNWYDEIYGYDINTAPIHEIEMSLTSNEAVKKILNNQESKTIINLRKEFATGQGDHAFAFAARLAKIYPISVKFITRDPRIIDFSMYGGRYYHVHDIARDRHGEYIRWLELTENNTNLLIENEILNKEYLFSWGDNEKIWVYFEKNKKIAKKTTTWSPEWSHGTEPLGIWGITKNGDLSIFITHEFSHNDPAIVLIETDGDFVNHDRNITFTFTNMVRTSSRKKLMM